MSEYFVAPAETPDAIEAPDQTIEAAVSRSPVFITVQEVAFSTAAAVPMPRPKPIRRMIAALRALFVSASEDDWPAPRHYPPRRDAFLEEAAMKREMHRL